MSWDSKWVCGLCVCVKVYNLYDKTKTEGGFKRRKVLRGGGQEPRAASFKEPASSFPALRPGCMGEHSFQDMAVTFHGEELEEKEPSLRP